MEHLDWNEPIVFDESVEKIEIQEYEPHVGTNLNSEHSDIKIVIQNQDQFLLPSQSYIYVEGKLIKEETEENYDFSKEEITLVNNGLMFLFDRMGYRINGEEIEGFNQPGFATLMKGLISYPESCNEKMQFFWNFDDGVSHSDNTKFQERLKHIKMGQGKFSGIIPLSHVFGFCENYDKVLYGVQHILTLRRGPDGRALFRDGKKDDEGDDEIADGKVVLSKLAWHIPSYKISDEYKVKLYKQIQDKTTVPIAYLNRQLEEIVVPRGQSQLDWRLNVTAGAEKPRYIIIGFQAGDSMNQTQNTSVFGHSNLKKAYVQLNSERYPENSITADFENNNYVHAYKLFTDFAKEQSGVNLRHYRDQYPLIVFDVSRQSEKLKNTVTDIKIKVQFSQNVSDNTHVYALVLSDRIIHMQSDGNKMNMIY